MLQTGNFINIKLLKCFWAEPEHYGHRSIMFLFWSSSIQNHFGNIEKQGTSHIFISFNLTNHNPRAFCLHMFQCIQSKCQNHCHFWQGYRNRFNLKVEKIFKNSLDSISSLSVKIQIMVRKVCLRHKGKTLLGIVNKLFVFKSLFITLSNVLPVHFSRP